ncbi:MAG: permease-like cell division protein FtsX [Panacagrimonas sp.]
MNLLRRWAAEHARVCIASLGRLWLEPVGTMLTALVIGLTLSLPAGLHLLVDNLRAAAGGLNQTRAITLFLHDAASPRQGEELAQSLAAREQVASADYVSRAAALDEFRARTGLSEVLDALGDNPLPASILVVPSVSLDDAGLQALAESLKGDPNVADLRLDAAWTARLDAALSALGQFGRLLGLALGLAVVIAIGNTIRLDIEARREEIAVMKLIGAPPGFIRRPFLYAGLWYGLVGGLLAVIAVQFAVMAMSAPVARLVELYEGSFALRGPGLEDGLGLIGLGVLLGLAGAWLAVSRHLGQAA